MEFGIATFAENKYDYFRWTADGDPDWVTNWVRFITLTAGYGDTTPLVATVGLADTVAVALNSSFGSVTLAEAWPGDYIIHTGALLFTVLDEREFAARSDRVNTIWRSENG